MRRSGSASCMLRPKNSLSSEDLQRLASWVKTGTPPTTVLTVVSLGSSSPTAVESSQSLTTATTIAAATDITTTSTTSSAASPSRQLVSSNCVVDRLYVLSQLQTHANNIRFVCEDALLSFHKSTTATTTTTTHDHAIQNDDDEDDKLIFAKHMFPPFPPSIILYLLWNDDSSAQTFVDGVITDCVRWCLQMNGDEDATAADGCRGGAEQENSIFCRGRISHQQQLWHLHQEGDDRRRRQQRRQQLTRIYVVVDRISSSPLLPSAPPLLDGENSSSHHQRPIHDDNDDDSVNVEAIIHHRYHCEVAIAKQLARAASMSTYLRERIDGITIGIASDDRATPGLVACMDAVERGGKERRKFAARRQVMEGGGGGLSTWWTNPTSATSAAKTTESNNSENIDHGDDEDAECCERRRNHMLGHIRAKSPERSPVAILAMHPEDLERVDHHHHHHQFHTAAINKLQCRVSTEWNGNGECNSFADRAMGDWREVWFENDTCGGGEHEIVKKDYGTRSSRRFNSRPKVSRVSRCGGSQENEDDESCNEPISTAMVIVFLVAVFAHVWNTYGDVIHSFLLNVFNDREA